MFLKKAKKEEKTNLFIQLFFIIFSVLCIIPLIVVFSASISSTADLTKYGFTLFPKEIDTTAYAYLFANPKQIIDGYKTTIFITVVGTFLSLAVMTMAAYALARPNFKFNKILTAYIFFPTLFGGGLVASYIINTQYLHLTDSVWVMILPGLVNVFNIIMLRTFMKQLPDGLFDAAKIDGASEWRIYFSIALPLSKPSIATVGFLGVLDRWNEWYRASIYIRSAEKYPLQYLLQRMMNNLTALQQSMGNAPSFVNVTELPGENLRMALLIVCIGPILMIFPFFQKYFVKGMTVGSVKG